jgi:hypothetical protein
LYEFAARRRFSSLAGYYGDYSLAALDRDGFHACAAQRGDRVERVGAGAPRSPAVGFWACYSARPIFFGRPAISLASPYRRYNVYCTGPPNPLARFTGKLRPRRHTPTILGGAFAGRATGHCRPLIRRQSRDIGALHLDEAVRSWMCTDEHQNKSLREMWWKIGSCLPSLGSALLPQSLQGELSRACGPRPCPRQEVVRLPSSLDVIMARITQSPRRHGRAASEAR